MAGRGLGIEFDSRKFVKLAQAYKYFPDVYACRNRATPDNIVPLLDSYEIEKNFSVLSLDIDGNDYWVLRAILSEFPAATNRYRDKRKNSAAHQVCGQVQP